MKKRFLALALCLVLATSLLPLTAAAEDITVEKVEITANGVKPNTEGLYDGYYGVDITSLRLKCAGGKEIDAIEENYTISSAVLGAGEYDPTPTTTEPLEPGTVYLLKIEIKPTDTLLPMSTKIPDSLTFTSGAYTTMPTGKVIRTDGILEIGFALQKNGAHDWDVRKEDSGTLTARCNDEDCTIGEVTVKLTAHSVTLPESPFNAEVQVGGDLKEAFPNAEIGELVYKYKGPGDSEYREIKPNAANAKAGEYQVGVQITGLPISPAAIAARGVQDNAGFADLYVQYTAVDPAITAQTGDNRPIELMMAGVVVFTALAAAAFILDNKRKYSR